MKLMEEEESDVEGRSRIKMKTKKKRQLNFEEEVAAVTTCGGTMVTGPCIICRFENDRAAESPGGVCVSCEQPGHLLQRCPNRQQAPLSRAVCQGYGREGVVLTVPQLPCHSRRFGKRDRQVAVGTLRPVRKKLRSKVRKWR